MHLIPIHLHDVAILAMDAALVSSRAGSFAMTTHELDHTAGIQAAHSAVGHQINAARLQQRLRNGLRFARFDIDGTAVATTWLAGGTGRYIDELNWMLPIGADELWLRDVFVAPTWRGRRLFTDMAAALARPADAPARRIWSDVDWDNIPSMRAHEAAGFRVVARARSLDFWGRIRLRSALPSWPLPLTEIETRSRWIWLHGAKLQRHQELLA